MIFLNAEIFIACIVLYNAGMGKMCKRFVAVVFVALVFLAVFLHGKQPSNDRAWSPDQDVLPTVKIEKENITITKKQGWIPFVSHRSGETMDTFIADLAVGLSCDYIKAGSPTRSERICKYNRLIEIEDTVGGA